VIRVTESEAYEQSPSFSPDGRRIVFSAQPPGEKFSHLYSCGLYGDRLRCLTRERTYDFGPTFSPDGSHIVFQRSTTYWEGRWRGWDIWQMRSDGSEQRRLTKCEYYGVNIPHYIEGGRQVLYGGSPPDTGGSDAWIVNTDGEQPPKRVTTEAGTWEPVPSPSGGVMVAISDHEVWRMNLDGSDRVPLTNTRIYKRSPGFMGSHKIFFLAFPKDRHNDGWRFNIWSVGIDGKGLELVADYRLFDDPMHWKKR
jgi:Tol biopolymer transport system component